MSVRARSLVHSIGRAATEAARAVSVVGKDRAAISTRRAGLILPRMSPLQWGTHQRSSVLQAGGRRQKESASGKVLAGNAESGGRPIVMSAGSAKRQDEGWGRLARDAMTGERASGMRLAFLPDGGAVGRRYTAGVAGDLGASSSRPSLSPARPARAGGPLMQFGLLTQAGWASAWPSAFPAVLPVAQNWPSVVPPRFGHGVSREWVHGRVRGGSVASPPHDVRSSVDAGFEHEDEEDNPYADLPRRDALRARGIMIDEIAMPQYPNLSVGFM